MWTLPHLNTQLYLNYKGFDSISGLENYIAVKALHLGNNNIAKIEGLDRMTDLRSLHLEGNRLVRIENLDSNLELRQLNLEGNCIQRVEGLKRHAKLEQLNLAHNSIAHLDDLEELRSLSKLSNIDVSHNLLDAIDGVIEFWSGLAASIRLLRYQANPGVRSIEHYRKRLINALPQLSYLDERPVFPVERRSSKAWAEGGTEAMHEAKREYAKERNQLLVTVDPERQELLTRMRKAAIARIEREERERQAKEEAQRSQGVESGDAEALAEYAKAWRNKVTLYGADGVREQIARESDVSAGSRAALPSKQADALRSSQIRHSFAPRPRASEDRIVADITTGKPSSTSTHSAREPLPQTLCVSDFRASAGSSCGGGAQLDWHERQFAVLGEASCNQEVSSESSSTTAVPLKALRNESNVARSEVMPDIWQRSQAQNAAEEMRCLEQNLSSSQGRSAGDELSVLD